jgi:hypothetical protein
LPEIGRVLVKLLCVEMFHELIRYQVHKL